MTRKQQIFKILSKKHAINILAYIYVNRPVQFSDICKNFNKISESSIRNITNKLSQTKLIKSIYLKDGKDLRKKGYVIDDESTVITLLELEI